MSCTISDSNLAIFLQNYSVTSTTKTVKIFFSNVSLVPSNKVSKRILNINTRIGVVPKDTSLVEIIYDFSKITECQQYLITLEQALVYGTIEFCAKCVNATPYIKKIPYDPPSKILKLVIDIEKLFRESTSHKYKSILMNLYLDDDGQQCSPSLILGYITFPLMVYPQSNGNLVTWSTTSMLNPLSLQAISSQSCCQCYFSLCAFNNESFYIFLSGPSSSESESYFVSANEGYTGLELVSSSSPYFYAYRDLYTWNFQEADGNQLVVEPSQIQSNTPYFISSFDGIAYWCLGDNNTIVLGQYNYANLPSNIIRFYFNDQCYTPYSFGNGLTFFYLTNSSSPSLYLSWNCCFSSFLTFTDTPSNSVYTFQLLKAQSEKLLNFFYLYAALQGSSCYFLTIYDDTSSGEIEIIMTSGSPSTYALWYFTSTPEINPPIISLDDIQTGQPYYLYNASTSYYIGNENNVAVYTKDPTSAYGFYIFTP